MMNLKINRQQTAVLMFVLIMAFSSIVFGQETEVRKLSPNQTVEREMTGEEIYRYKFDLKSGEFFQIRVEQKGVDVIVKLFDSNRKLLTQSDNPNLKYGYEILTWVTESQGNFEIEIIPYKDSDKTGKYNLQKIESRTATDVDRKRVENEKLFREAMVLHSARDETELAELLPLLDKIYQGWKELGDDYMSWLTERQYASVAVAQNESLNQKDLSLYLGFTKEELKNEAVAIVTAGLIFRKFGAKRYDANFLLRYGYINTLLGEVEIGLKAFNKALIIQKSISYKRGEAISNLVIGKTLYLLGENQKSLNYLEEALKIFKNVNDKSGEAITQINLGSVYENLGKYKEASKFYDLAVESAKATDDDITYYEAWEAITDLAVYGGKAQIVIEYYETILEFKKSIGDKRGEAHTLNSIAFAYTEWNEKQKAIDYYLQSIFISRNIGDKQSEAVTLNNLMFTFESLNQAKLAILYGKLAVNNFQELRKSIQGLDIETQRTYLGTIEGTYRKLSDILITQGRIAEAEQVLAMLKEDEYFSYLRRDDAVAADLKARISLSPDEKKAFEDYEKFADEITKTAEEFGVLEKKKNALALGESLSVEDQKQYDLLKSKYDAAVTVFNKYLDDLKVKFSENDKRVATVESDTQGLLKKLNQPRTVIISTIVGEDRLNLIVTTSDIQKAHTVEVKAADLNRLVAEFRDAVKNPSVDPRPLGKKLYDKLFPHALQKDLENIKADTIVWSLDGTLRYVPMAALFDGEKYLVERFQNAVLTLASRDKLSVETNANRQKWLAFGVGVSKKFETFNELPAVPKELCSVVDDPKKKEFCDKFGAGGVFDGLILADDEFTLAGFTNNLGKTPIVHIASHFSLNAGDFKDSYLLLGGGNQRRFSLDELKKTRLDNIELLTLSACNTAMTSGANSSGVEVEGFGALAQKQGVKSVLATLWAVADDSTGELMTEFYKILETNPKIGKAEALRTAQLKMISGEHEDLDASAKSRSDLMMLKGDNANQPKFETDEKAPFAHPYYWSPFVLIGNWR